MGTDNSSTEGVRHRETHATSRESSSSPEFSPDQKDRVDRINRASSHYDMLGVSQAATEEEIKRSYKKLALQVHPDKNRAPGATDAFKALGKAVSVLTDSEKRRQYDQYGDSADTHNHSRESYRRTYNTFDTEVTPEDIFNAFFNGQSFTYQSYSRPQSSRRSRTAYQYRTNRERQAPDGFSTLFQLSPIIMMMILSLLTFALQGEDPFKFSRSEKYSVEVETKNLGVKYFVKEGFANVYSGNSLRKIEREIENTYVTNLRYECQREQILRENLKWKARYNNDGQGYENANNMKLHNCLKLQSIYA